MQEQTTVFFYSLANLTNQFDKCAYTRCNGTVTFPGAGAYRIFWLSLNGCAIDTARQFVTVLDAEPQQLWVVRKP